METAYWNVNSSYLHYIIFTAGIPHVVNMYYFSEDT